MSTKIICIIGKSSTGKSTFCDYLKKYFNYNFIISHTSRDKRPNEENGVDYFFVSKEEFEEMISKDLFLDVNVFNGWYYGISKEAFKKNKINAVVIDPAGFKKLRTMFGKENVIGIHIKAPLFTRVIRYVRRQGNIKFELFRRFLADYKDFKNIDKLTNTYKLMGTIPLSVNKDIFERLINEWIENTLD